MTFQEALSRTCGNNWTYVDMEMEALWNVLQLVPAGATVCEIGCEHGRSTSMILQASKDWQIILIDPFINDEGKFAGGFLTNVRAYNVPFTLHMMTSERAYPNVPYLDFVHIDGDHSEEGLSHDCEYYLGLLKSGGIAVFHDYEYPDTPAVKILADKFTEGWPLLAHAGRCYAVRKP